VFLPYQYGLEGEHPIYDLEQIEQAKKSPDFAREYAGAYLGTVGNVFSPQSIENCQKIEYNPDRIIPNCRVSVGVDPAFGNSNFAIVVNRYVDGKIQVVIAEEYSRPDFQPMLDRIWEIKQQIVISAICNTKWD
jgi:phage terminase large subunit